MRACAGGVKWRQAATQALVSEFCVFPSSNRAPVLCLGFLPCLYPLCVQHVPPARQHLTPEFYLRWGCVTNGQVIAYPRKCLSDCSMAEVQRLWQTTIYSWCQVSLHSGVFVPISANMAALQGLLGPLPVGRPYGLYQMHSKQGNSFFPCGMWTTQTLLPSPGDYPCFLTRAPPGTEILNFRFCASLFIESWWY